MDNYIERDKSGLIDIPKSLQLSAVQKSNTIRAASSCTFCESCEEPCQWDETACGWSELPCDWCEVDGQCGECQYCQGCESRCETYTQGTQNACSVSAEVRGNTISYSWTASANTWWNIDVYTPDGNQKMIASGRGNTYGSGTYNASDYGIYYIYLYVSFSSGTPSTAYKGTSVNIVKTTITATIYNVYDSGTPTYSGTESLTIGALYTPSNASHIPQHTSGYSLTQIYTTINSWTNYTTGSFITPNYDISIYYYWSKNTLNCPVYVYYDGVEQSGLRSSRSLTVGISYTPSESLPTYDSSKYRLDSIGLYNSKSGVYSDVTSRSFIPENNGVYNLDYFFKKKSVEKWSWSKSNGSASDTQTLSSYYSLSKGSECSGFSHLVWNDLCDKVDEILRYLSSSWNSTYLSLTNTKMTSNLNMTAKRFNSLRNNIDLHYSTGLPTVAAGDVVMANYFLTFASKINSWIDSIAK